MKTLQDALGALSRLKAVADPKSRKDLDILSDALRGLDNRLLAVELTAVASARKAGVGFNDILFDISKPNLEQPVRRLLGLGVPSDRKTDN